MRKLKLFLSLLMLISFSVGTVWAETATITFANQTSGTGDGSTAYTTSTIISSGIASSDAAFGTITCSATSKCYSGKVGMGMKVGASSNAGSFTFSFTALPNVSKITLNRAAYNDSKAATITVKNGTTTLGSASTGTTTTLNDMDINNLNIASLSSLTVESNKYCYIKSITITYTPAAAKTLSSISVKTAPTKVTYTEGEFFDPTGLVITATYSDASTSDVAYKDNEDKFSFSPALNEALETTDAQVTITYAEKSVDQAITVSAAPACSNEVNVYAGATEHGSFNLSTDKVCGDGDGGIVFITSITPAEGYELDEITATVGDIDKENNKVTGITENTTITVTFKELPKYTVSFSTGAGNPAQVDIKEASYGAGITLPAGPTPACSADGWTFAGWKETSAVDVETTTAPTLLAAGANYKPAEDCTLYAVYKRTGGGDGAPIGTTMWAEAFSDFKAANQPSAPGASTTVYGSASISYKCETSYTQVYEDANAGGASPEILIPKSSRNGYFEITGIPTGLATTLTLSYKTNQAGMNVTSATDGVAIGDRSGTNPYSRTITIDKEKAPANFSLKFAMGSDTNARLDNISVEVATSSSAGTTYYLSAPTCCTKHTITVDNEIEHGSVTASLTEACENTKVKLTPTPATHCQFVSWNVKDEDEGSIDVAADSTFTMPDKDVTVSATFEEIKNAVTFATPTGGTLVVKHNDATVSTGDLIKEGETVKLVYAADAVNHYIGGTVTVKDASNADVDVAADSTFVMPGKAVTISASFTATYAINIVADGGNVALDYTKGGAEDGYAIAGTTISAEATADDAHTFSALALSENVTEKDIDANVAMFTMPAEAVTITATFAVKTTPTIGVSTDIIEFAPVDYKGALAAQTFNVSGAALAAGKLSISCDNAAFTVSPAEIDVDGTLAATEVTVTPKTTSCGTFNGTITISGGSAAAVNVSVKLTVNKLANGLAWKKGDDVATEATVTIDANDNVFPTLYNPLGLEGIEYSSYDDEVASINVSTGAIELKKAGLTYIVANFAGNDTVAALAEDALAYALTVQKKYTAKWYVNGVEQEGDRQVALLGTDLNIPSDPTKLADDCEELVFKGWASAPIVGKQDDAPAYANLEGIKMADHDTAFYAVFAVENSEEAGDPDWVEITAVPTAGTYAICTAEYFMKAEISDKTRFNNGATAPSITDGKLDAAPASDCQWVVSINGSDKFLFKNGTNYAGGTSTKNQGALLTDATDSHAQWEITYVENQFVIKNVGRASDTNDKNNAYLRQNAANGWATYAASTGSAPRLFKCEPKEPVKTYSDYMTTCPTCTTVALTKGATSNGSFQFQVGGVEVSSVKTCEDANVDVVFIPAEGYELSAFTITGVDGASYNEGVISIPHDATGTLIATAEFGLENHKVTMAQTGGAEAEISADQNNKHAGDEITVTANDVDGYYFIGWAASPEVSFANAKALSTTFTMPSSDVTVTAKYTKILTVAEAVAIIDADKSKTTSDVVVEAYVSSFFSSSVSSGQISYFIQDKDENGFLTGTEFEAYKGKGLNGADFNALDDIAVGDKVRIFGSIKYYSSGDVYEFNANNYLLAQTVKGEVTSVEVYGTASKTEYFNNEDFEFTGLKAKQVFENGYAEEIASPAWAASPAKVTVSGNVAVTATYNEKTSAPYNVAVTKVLREPTLSWSEETPVYLVGQVNTFPTVNNPKSLPLTYESSAPAVADIDENGDVTLHTAGATTLKFSFAGDDEYAAKQNVEYNLVVYDLESVSVNGTANVTAYEAGSAFDRTGLTAQANYKSGELTTNFNITEDATVAWSCDPATVEAGTSKVTVSATWNGKTGTKDVSVAILTHTVQFEDPEHGSLVVKNAGTPIVSGAKFANGTVLTVEANPEENYYLAALTVNLTDIKAEKEFTVGILTDYTVVATFAERTDAPISWGKESESIALNGDVATLQALTNDEDLTVVYSSNNIDVATVDPATGAITLKDVGSAQISAKYTATTEGQYKTTTVTYTLNVTAATYAVTFNAPTNGTLVIRNGSETIESGDEFVEGTELDVVAAPASGYLLATLTANGEDIKSSAKVIIGTADVVVVATFEKDATALDNTEASEKVVKTMENGVLIIRRGDKTYNGQGQLVK